MPTEKDTLLDTILANTDIVELINETTALSKKGKNHMGLCPFHEEKTPSFSVSEDKQLYHCFSCKASGNALTFIKDTKNLSTQAAIEYLAARAGIETKGRIKADPLQKYYDINQEAQEFFRVMLNHTKSGQAALDYLKKRDLTKATLEAFDIGLAPSKRDSLYQALTEKSILASDMQDLGLISEEEPYHDTFKDRIMFPLHDENGHVIGFSGRTYKKSNAPKYINSTKTATFEKSKVLYNLHRAKGAMKKNNRAVIFEGFMDVIKAHQAGVEEGLAIMGTAFTRAHIDLLKQYTTSLIICFDGDDAGQEATEAVLKSLRQSPFDIMIAPMPKGMDPDDYITRYGHARFKQLLEQAWSPQEFYYKKLFAQVDPGKLTDIEWFKKQVFKTIDSLSNVQQNYFLNMMSNDLNVPVETLALDFKAIKPSSVPTYKKIERIEVTDKFKRAERAFIHYFLHDEFYARRFRREFDDVTYIDKQARDIQFEIFEYYDFNRQSCIVPALFYERLTHDQQQFFDKYIDMPTYPFNDSEFEDLLGVMREYTRRHRIESLRKQLKSTKSIEEKIRLRKKIDAMIKEANHGKRKNYSRTY